MYKLLVVDDEQKIREIISKYAQFEGYSVEEAPDGMTAIDMFKEKDYDLVILDVMLPDLDGFSVCRELRKTSPHSGHYAVRTRRGIRPHTWL